MNRGGSLPPHLQVRMLRFTLLLVQLVVTLCSIIIAHPTGNMILSNGSLYWPYIDEISDKNHYACVMKWDKTNKPKVVLKSQFPASDFMLFDKSNQMFIIERRFVQTEDKFKIRLLKLSIDDTVSEVWGWIEDKWRVGEAGFYIDESNNLLFAKYPNMYKMDKDLNVSLIFESQNPIKKVRNVDSDKLLLFLGDEIWLTDVRFNLLKKWKTLIDTTVTDSFLGMNSVFDADYINEKLVYAYWGKRTFELIDSLQKREVLLQTNNPFIPHWVAIDNDVFYLFSSNLSMHGDTPRPYLIQYDKGIIKEIWSVN